MKTINVTKRNGTREPYQVEKIQKQVEYACAGLSGVSQSMIEIGMNLELYDGIHTSHIDQLAINSALNLIDPKVEGGHTNYQFVAGRLQNSVLRKMVYGQFDPPHLYDIVVRGVAAGILSKDLLDRYGEDEWDLLNQNIDHSLDEAYSYSAIKQFIDKYLIRNRATGEFFDTPQVRYMVAAATVMIDEPDDVRLEKVIEYYKLTSQGYFTLPTPQLAGLGTETRQFSSCVLLRSDDSMDSIFATGEVLSKYSSKRAGIGLEIGRMRSLGAPIRNGEVKHTGLVPFIKKWFGDLRCASQGGIRNSSCTVNYQWWHLDFESLICLKNNAGTDETRVRHMDYTVVLNKLLFKRYLNGEFVTLFDPNDVPELYEAFYRDSDEFERLYVEAENNPGIHRKKVVKASEIVDSFLKERADTNRIYAVFIDNVIAGAPTDPKVDPIYQSNLCVTGDTLIETNHGLMQIKDLLKHSGGPVFVKSRLVEFGAGDIWTRASVVALTAAQTDDLWEIEYEGKKLRCTGDHKIFTENRGWVEARNLEEDDKLVVSDFDEVSISKGTSTQRQRNELRDPVSKPDPLVQNRFPEGQD